MSEAEHQAWIAGATAALKMAANRIGEYAAKHTERGGSEYWTLAMAASLVDDIGPDDVSAFRDADVGEAE